MSARTNTIIKLPGLIDVHVHLREPGATQKEDFYSGTQAAIAGGYTQILDMPNNTPPTITPKDLDDKIKLAKNRIWCDLGFNFGATPQSIKYFKQVAKKVFGLKIYMSHTTGPLMVEKIKDLDLIFKSWPGSLPIMIHAQDEVVEVAIKLAKKYKKTYDDLPKDLISEVILVDDASRDKTVETAKKIGLTVYVHPKNRGYGGNQKTCYDQALKRNPDIVIMVHPDYQYDAKLVGVMCEPIVNGRADVMLGSRIQTRAQVLAGGMPMWKYFANRFLTLVENLAMGLNLSEYHTGFRAFSKEVLKTIPYHQFSDDFVFDQQILISALSYGFNISELPVPCKYFKEASSINFKRSSTYGILTLWTVFTYLLHTTDLIKFKIFKK